MRYALANLARNLAAGLRLAFFLRVSPLAFRFDLAQLLLLFLVSALLDVGRDVARTGPDRVFSLLGAGTEFFAAGVLLFIAALLALLYRRRELALAIPVIVLASLPALQVALELPVFLRAFGLPDRYDAGIEYAVLAWIVVVFVRCVFTALAEDARWRVGRAVLGGLLLALPIWFGTDLAPNDPWFVRPAERPIEGLNAGSEPVLAAQSFLLDQLLEKIDDERPGVTDLYFVAFAPWGLQDVFRKDVEAAQKVMDERWGTAERSIVLVNNPQTLLTAPFATVTNLRETLNEIGGAIDEENDVVMVYLSSHGTRDHRLAAAQPPLSLVDLTPAGLRQMLDDAGIGWRIVVVAACYSGGFIDPLKDPRTLVITASHADRTSFGCSDRNDATYFGEAFFQQGLAKTDSFDTAFELAKKRVEEREQAAGYKTPSLPQMWVGEEMAEKMKSLRGRGNTGGVTAKFGGRSPFAARPRAVPWPRLGA